MHSLNWLWASLFISPCSSANQILCNLLRTRWLASPLKFMSEHLISFSGQNGRAEVPAWKSSGHGMMLLLSCRKHQCILWGVPKASRPSLPQDCAITELLMFWSSRDCAPSIEAGMGAIPWLYCRALWLLLLKSEQNVRLMAGGKLLHHADFLEIHFHPKQTTPLFRQLRASVWMPCLEAGCGMKVELRPSGVIAFWLHNPVPPPLMLPWLLLGTTHGGITSLSCVCQSVSRAAVRKVKYFVPCTWNR